MLRRVSKRQWERKKSTKMNKEKNKGQAKEKEETCKYEIMIHETLMNVVAYGGVSFSSDPETSVDCRKDKITFFHE